MTGADVFKRVRFLLNDNAITYFTDTVLLDPVNIALDDLRGELADNNIPISNTASAIIKITAGMSVLNPSSTPPIPVNLIEIQEILERPWGASGNFSPVKRYEYIPAGMERSNELLYWSWQNESIHFVPANSDREIQINYISQELPDIIGPASNINMIRSLPFLAYRSAALAAENLGEDPERAAQLNQNAGRELDKLMNLSVKGKQVMPVRRRPFIGVTNRA